MLSYRRRQAPRIPPKLNRATIPFELDAGLRILYLPQVLAVSCEPSHSHFMCTEYANPIAQVIPFGRSLQRNNPPFAIVRTSLPLISADIFSTYWHSHIPDSLRQLLLYAISFHYKPHRDSCGYEQAVARAMFMALSLYKRDS